MKGYIRIGFVLAFLFLVGCSGGGGSSVVSPSYENDTAPASTAYPSERLILAIGTISLDVSGHPCPETMNIAFIPDREAAKHWDVTPMLMPPACDDCVTIEILEFKPADKSISLKVTLKNPASVAGYDVRGIVMTNDPDVRLINADAYTDLWDDGGAVRKNPFRRFADEVPGHMFDAQAVHSQTYDFTYKALSGLAGAKLIVDASWPGHCKEAWDIHDQESSSDLAPDPASSVLVTCVVEDWQADWGGVELDISSLGFPAAIPMNGAGGVYWAFVFNQFSAPPGDYRIWFEAMDPKTPVRLHDDLMITVAAETPPNFKLKPGEVFVEASWDWPEQSAFVSEYHLYKREMGDEYDYGNPIVVPSTKSVYLDEDVLAGHMYFYRLSAAYSLGESELAEEHGAKPFKWGPIVQVSDSPGTSMLPEIARGLDDSIWVVWDFGWLENLDDMITPDWNVHDYAFLPGDTILPKIAVDADGYVHITGEDEQQSTKIRYIKCDPYYGGVLIDKYVVEEVNGSTVNISVDSKGMAHLVYIDNPPGVATKYQVFYLTIDPDGNVSEPLQISSGYVDGVFYYTCSRATIHVGKSGTIHASWKGGPGGKSRWNYRACVDGKWEPEEIIWDYGGAGIEYNLWEDLNGNVHFSDSGLAYWYRDANGWSEPFATWQTYPMIFGEGGGWVSGDDFGNVMFIWSWRQFGEVTYRQHYSLDWSDEYHLTTGHEQTGYWAEDSTIAVDRDGLAVVVWHDDKPNGWWEILMRRQIME